MFEIHYKYTDYQTFKQTFRELFFPFLIIFQPLIRISNATALLLKIACLPQAGIEKLEIVAFSIRFIKKSGHIFHETE